MQLTIKDILDYIEELKKQGMSQKEIENLAVYIGDDDELNGIHTAWYCQKIDDEEDGGFVELIEEGHNAEFTGSAILIS